MSTSEEATPQPQPEPEAAPAEETTTEPETTTVSGEEASDSEATDAGGPQPTEASEQPSGPSGDPALDDPEAFAAERFEGTTSDAATRAEGTVAAEVAPDAPAAEKPSDAGEEQYPFPPQGDVEVATVPEAAAKDDEFPPAFNVDDWVQLDGSHDAVPDVLDGHIAIILKAPSEPVGDAQEGDPYAARTPIQDENIIVRTRDKYNAVLSVPLDAIQAVGRGGRTELVPFG